MALRHITAVSVGLDKLRDYCLNEGHPRGRHKARVFRARLGLTAADAEWLRQSLMKATAERMGDLRATMSDSFGDRYLLDVEVAYGGRTAMVRCAWIVRPGEEVISLITCYIL